MTSRMGLEQSSEKNMEADTKDSIGPGVSERMCWSHKDCREPIDLEDQASHSTS